MTSLAVLGAMVATSPPALALDGVTRLPTRAAFPSQRLSNEVSRRWVARGFKTSMLEVNGVSLHVAQAGRGPLVVLLHGYPQSGEIWRFVAPDLAQGHHVVIPDLPGLGLSEVAPNGYDLSNVAEDIHRLVQSLGYSKVVVVGHDWGGSVAAVYALRYRDEVTKLAFLESALPGGGFEDLWTFTKPNSGFAFIPFLLMGGVDPARDTTAALIHGRESVFLRHLWSGFTGDRRAAPFENWTPYVQAMARPGVATAGSSYYRSAYQSADEVRTLIVQPLEIPVLSLAGEKGIGVRQEPFVSAFANNVTATVVIPGAGHFLAEERPAEVLAALQTFLGD